MCRKTPSTFRLWAADPWRIQAARMFTTRPADPTESITAPSTSLTSPSRCTDSTRMPPAMRDRLITLTRAASVSRRWYP